MPKAQPTAPALGYRFPRDPADVPTDRPEREIFTNTCWGKGIYEAALSRKLSPFALTVAVLIDIAAQIGPHVLIDLPFSNGVQSGLAAMFIGRSGAGKTATMTAASEVVTLLPDDHSSLPGNRNSIAVAGGGSSAHKLLRLGGLASGQALGDRLKTVATEAYDSNGEPIGYDYAQEHDRILVSFDEGTTLVKSSSGEGSILLEAITSALTGGSLDGVKVSREQSRDVPGGSYSASFMLGIQPGMAAPLLSKDSLGFTQRWLVIPALPTITKELNRVILPRVETYEVHAPAEWLEKRTRPDMEEGWTTPSNRNAATMVPVDHDVALEMSENQSIRSDPDFDGELLDAHRDLFRLKLALPIALLESERHISKRAWELAGIIMDISSEARDKAIAEARDLETAAAADREAVRIGARAAAEDQAMRDKIGKQASRLLEEARKAGTSGFDASGFIRNRVASGSRKSGGSAREDARTALSELEVDGRLVIRDSLHFIPEFAPAPPPSLAAVTGAKWEANTDVNDTDYPIADTPPTTTGAVAVAGSE